jgi:hypothetical protein
MKDELMICPKATGCNNPWQGPYCSHRLPHQFCSSCTVDGSFVWREKRCPACEKFLGVVVKNERRIGGMSESKVQQI